MRSGGQKKSKESINMFFIRGIRVDIVYILKRETFNDSKLAPKKFVEETKLP